MCVRTPNQFSCGHRYGWTINLPCMHGRPYSSSEIATCLIKDYKPYPDPEVYMKAAKPIVCPECYRSREELIFDEADEKIRQLNERKEKFEMMMAGDSMVLDRRLAEAKHKQLDQSIKITEKERERKLEDWRRMNGVWGDG